MPAACHWPESLVRVADPNRLPASPIRVVDPSHRLGSLTRISGSDAGLARPGWHGAPRFLARTAARFSGQQGRLIPCLWPPGHWSESLTRISGSDGVPGPRPSQGSSGAAAGPWRQALDFSVLTHRKTQTDAYARHGCRPDTAAQRQGSVRARRRRGVTDRRRYILVCLRNSQQRTEAGKHSLIPSTWGGGGGSSPWSTGSAATQRRVFASGSKAPCTTASSSSLRLRRATGHLHPTPRPGQVALEWRRARWPAPNEGRGGGGACGLCSLMHRHVSDGSAQVPRVQRQ